MGAFTIAPLVSIFQISALDDNGLLIKISRSTKFQNQNSKIVNTRALVADMSQEVRTPNPTLDAPPALVVDPSQTPFLAQEEVAQGADTLMSESANSVMDDVFEDVERILRDGSTLPMDMAQVEPKAKNPLSSLAESWMPSLLATRSGGPTTDALEIEVPNLDADLEVPDVDVDGLAAIATETGDLSTFKAADATSTQPVAPKSFDQLLLTLATVSVIVTGGLWLLAQVLWRTPTPVATPSVAEPVAVSQANQEFMNYVQRSLDVIDRKVAVSEQTTTVANGANLPDVAVAGNLPLESPQVLERVYVPVYQPPGQVGAGALVPSPVTGQVAVANTPPAAAPATLTPGSGAPNVAAVITYELVGLLELGDRSAALFEVNGTAQRIELGEAIGASGWTLVSVSNQEALIRRNGEVRSVYVGQTF